MKVNTTYAYPPIPCRDFDWQATLDGYDPGDPAGVGATEQAAIEDLKEQLADEYAALYPVFETEQS